MNSILDLVQFLVQYSFFLMAASIHESAHAWSAYKFGDPTAKMQNRISLNPANHIDILGTVIIPFFVFLSGIPVIGWAKPTPVNPMNFANPRKDGMYVSGAGPVSNVICVAGLAVLWHASSFLINLRDGQISSLDRIGLILCYIIAMGIVINLVLAIFNMLPIHPLDGSGVLEGLLPDEWAASYARMRPYGFLLLLAIFYLSPLPRYIWTIVLKSMQLMGVVWIPLEKIW